MERAGLTRSCFRADSDSDSELSLDEHSSSYASSHSSDSEDDGHQAKPQWNNERQPVHSTPKGAGRPPSSPPDPHLWDRTSCPVPDRHRDTHRHT